MTETYPAIRNDVCEAAIGKHRWHGCIKAIWNRLGRETSIRVAHGSHGDDPIIEVNGHPWGTTGRLSELEDWAKAQYRR